MINILCYIIIISQRAATVTSPAWLAYGLPMVFYSSFLFIPGVISAVTYPIAEFFNRHTCHVSGMSMHVSNFEKLSYLFHRVLKTAKMQFSRVFLLGDLTFFITAQKRVEFGKIQKQISHQR
jgi:hypothetical protein